MTAFRRCKPRSCHSHVGIHNIQCYIEPYTIMVMRESPKVLFGWCPHAVVAFEAWAIGSGCLVAHATVVEQTSDNGKDFICTHGKEKKTDWGLTTALTAGRKSVALALLPVRPSEEVCRLMICRCEERTERPWNKKTRYLKQTKLTYQKYTWRRSTFAHFENTALETTSLTTSSYYLSSFPRRPPISLPHSLCDHQRLISRGYSASGSVIPHTTWNYRQSHCLHSCRQTPFQSANDRYPRVTEPKVSFACRPSVIFPLAHVEPTTQQTV